MQGRRVFCKVTYEHASWYLAANEGLCKILAHILLQWYQLVSSSLSHILRNLQKTEKWTCTRLATVGVKETKHSPDPIHFSRGNKQDVSWPDPGTQLQVCHLLLNMWRLPYAETGILCRIPPAPGGLLLFHLLTAVTAWEEQWARLWFANRPTDASCLQQKKWAAAQKQHLAKLTHYF